MHNNIFDIFCQFTITNDGFKCVKCGTIVVIADAVDEPPLLPCRNQFSVNRNDIAEVVSKNSDSQSMENMTTKEQIESRYDICLKCEHFQNYSCSQCGCLISRDRNYMNKLSDPQAKCPVNKW